MRSNRLSPVLPVFAKRVADGTSGIRGFNDE
jgi:hypothetical protein